MVILGRCVIYPISLDFFSCEGLAECKDSISLREKISEFLVCTKYEEFHVT